MKKWTKKLWGLITACACAVLFSLSISASAIEVVTLIAPEDPTAVYGLMESGTLSNGIEYWVIKPTPAENVKLDSLRSYSKTVKEKPPIANGTGANDANVAEAFAPFPDEYVCVRVGGLPSTMPTVNVGCHYVNGDKGDWYPSVGAQEMAVFRIECPSDDVQITASTHEAASVTTSFTIFTSDTNPADSYGEAQALKTANAQAMANLQALEAVKQSVRGPAADVTAAASLEAPLTEAETEALIHAQSTFLPKGYSVNSHGETYGSAVGVTEDEDFPDLIACRATNGERGYLRHTERLAVRGKGPATLPVYDREGEEIIGYFQIHAGR